MDLRKEEKKKRNLLSKINNKKEDIKGIFLVILFFTMIYLIKEVTPRMAQFVLMLEEETLATFFEVVLTSTFIAVILTGLKKEMSLSNHHSKTNSN